MPARGSPRPLAQHKTSGLLSLLLFQRAGRMLTSSALRWCRGGTWGSKDLPLSMSAAVIKARVTHQPGFLGTKDCGLQKPHAKWGCRGPCSRCTCMQLGKTLTLMVRSAESAAESRQPAWRRLPFGKTGSLWEFAEKQFLKLECGHRWWWGWVSGPVAGKPLMARRPLRDVSPSGAPGALGKSPDSVGGRQRAPKVALAADSQVTLGGLLCVSGPQPLLSMSPAAWQGLQGTGLWRSRN